MAPQSPRGHASALDTTPSTAPKRKPQRAQRSNRAGLTVTPRGPDAISNGRPAPPFRRLVRSCEARASFPRAARLACAAKDSRAETRPRHFSDTSGSASTTGGGAAVSVMKDREYPEARSLRDQGDTNLCRYDSGRHRESSPESCHPPDAGGSWQTSPEAIGKIGFVWPRRSAATTFLDDQTCGAALHSHFRGKSAEGLRTFPASAQLQGRTLKVGETPRCAI
jgi:hypothetical protein